MKLEFNIDDSTIGIAIVLFAIVIVVIAITTGVCLYNGYYISHIGVCK